jgi:glycosyltransferase 2 family protein
MQGSTPVAERSRPESGGMRWMWLIKLIGLGFFIYLFVTIDRTKVLNLLARGSLVRHLGLAALLSITIYNVLKGLRWHLILRWIDVPYSFWQTYVTYQASVFIGLLTPGRLGEMFRSVYLRSDAGLPISAGIASTGADRMFDLVGLLALGGAALLIDPRFGVHQGMGWYFLGGAAAVVTALFFFRRADGARLRGANLFGNYFIGHLLSDFNHQLRRLKPVRALIQASITAATIVVYCIQCGLLASAVGIDISPLTAGGIAAVANLVVVIPVTIYGLGTREVTIVTLMGLMGVAAEEAFSFSLLIFLNFWIIGALWGCLFWLLKPMRFETAKAISERGKTEVEKGTPASQA